MIPLPNNTQPVVGQGGIATPAFYRFFGALARELGGSSDGWTAAVATLNARVDELDAGVIVHGGMSIASAGSSASGVITLSLVNDLPTPGKTYFYGTSTTGGKGWHAVSSTLSSTADISRTVGTDGLTTLGLADLADSGTGAALVKITRDAKGRVSGTHSATTSDLTEGSNLYYTDARADARVDAGIAAHVAEADPHTQYLTATEAPAAIFGTVDTSATAGTATALPAQPSGYVEVVIGGVTKKLPFYD